MIDDVGERARLREAAIGELAAMAGGGDRGVFNRSNLRSADALRSWIRSLPGLQDFDLADVSNVEGLLRAIDTHAERHPTAATTVGRGRKYTTTDVVRAVGWLIRIDSSRGSGSGLEQRRKDAQEATGIGVRELAPKRVREHGLYEAYLQYLADTLADDRARAEVLSMVETPHPTTASVETGRLGNGSQNLAVAGLVVLIALLAIALVYIFWPAADSAEGETVQSVQMRYDGKDPRGYDSPESKCADPPPSDRVGATEPSVLGPDGSPVATIVIRTSATCPSVVWARVVWGGDPNGHFRIPDGWTLHTLLHRPSTSTTIEERDRSESGVPVPLVLSGMLATAGGHCVYAEAYFSAPSGRTSPSTTSCVTTQ